jgi:hypothetical protein
LSSGYWEAIERFQVIRPEFRKAFSGCSVKNRVGTGAALQDFAAVPVPVGKVTMQLFLHSLNVYRAPTCQALLALEIELINKIDFKKWGPQGDYSLAVGNSVKMRIVSLMPWCMPVVPAI